MALGDSLDINCIWHGVQGTAFNVEINIRKLSVSMALVLAVLVRLSCWSSWMKLKVKDSVCGVLY